MDRHNKNIVVALLFLPPLMLPSMESVHPSPTPQHAGLPSGGEEGFGTDPIGLVPVATCTDQVM
jgi:hypothetical protein